MSAVSNLAEHMGYLLRMVSNAVSQEFARKLAGEGITVAEWAMLRSLYANDRVTPTALADRMSLSKGAISKLVARLLEKGLIEREGDPDDKRAYTLSLSATGAERVPALARIADENDADFFEVLSHKESATLRGLLHALIDRHRLSVMPTD